jgi:hypothetical protein
MAAGEEKSAKGHHGEENEANPKIGSVYYIMNSTCIYLMVN